MAKRMNTSIWTVTFAHESLWKDFQGWLEDKGLQAFLVSFDRDEDRYCIAIKEGV